MSMRLWVASSDAVHSFLKAVDSFLRRQLRASIRGPRLGEPEVAILMDGIKPVPRLPLLFSSESQRELRPQDELRGYRHCRHHPHHRLGVSQCRHVHQPSLPGCPAYSSCCHYSTSSSWLHLLPWSLRCPSSNCSSFCCLDRVTLRFYSQGHLGSVRLGV
jgi:hypothetical protein